MTYFMALLIALSALTQAPSEAPTQALSQAPITAPSQALTYEAPKVGTQPAPKAPVQAPLKAPTQPLYKAPVQAPLKAPQVVVPKAPVKAPVQAPQPTVAPQCEEDQPCWDCATMGNKICGTAAPAPKVDPYSGNPIVNCEAQGLATAEDFSCVNPDFWK